MTRMVPGLILAAGKSVRMGQPKALLPSGPGAPTFVHRLATTLRDGGVADVLVVGRADDEMLRREVDSMQAAARFVPNEHADLGQLSSVTAGLNAADRPGVSAVLIAPVDAPFIKPATVAALLSVWAARRAPLVRPIYRGRHGHPVVFARAIFDELRRADPSIGAKAVVQAHQSDLLNLDVDDPAVVDDIDGPDDYARVLSDVR
jgi:molybdenum cofactor cytidylyltransferase